MIDYTPFWDTLEKSDENWYTLTNRHHLSHSTLHRLSALRIRKGVSARDMSLSLGQNPGYINNIESGKALPSMSQFFYICDYLQITPKDFFETKIENPTEMKELHLELTQLNAHQLACIHTLVKELIKKP